MPFDFQEIIALTAHTKLKKAHYITASDGVQLAYYSFVPKSPRAALLFYHGGGIWSNELYQYMANKLAEDIAVYLFDIRGHGNSFGLRGSAPHSSQVFQDVDTALDFVEGSHKGLPLILGGHSSGAGLLLNYNFWSKKDRGAKFLFLAPFLGDRSGALQKLDSKSKFVKKVRLLAILAHAFSGGKLCSHTPAVFFNYPLWIYEKDPLVLTNYSCAMAQAVFPRDAQALLAKIKEPIAILIGENDEQFLPERVCEHKNYLKDSVRSFETIVPRATHLSIVCQTDEIMKYIFKLLST